VAGRTLQRNCNAAKMLLDEKVSSPGAAIAGLFFDHEKNTLVTVDEMDESCRQVTNVYKILVGKLEGKR